jgi:chitinase
VARQIFVKVAIRFFLDERLDWIDLDWEHPKEDKVHAGYAGLLVTCRKRFQPHGQMLSATIVAWRKLPSEAFSSVDAIHVMSCDNKGWHSSFDLGNLP